MKRHPFFKNDITVPQNTNLDERADYIEIRCLLNPDGIFTLDALADDFEDAEYAGDMAMHEMLLEEEEDRGIDHDIFPEISPDEFDEISSSTGIADARKQEREERIFREAFNRLESRGLYLGDAYPFEVESGRYAKVRSDLSDARKTYIVFLISANLRLATPSGIARIGNLFEQICGPFFKHFLPEKGECHHFGAAAGEDALFKGGLEKKLEVFCEVFKTRLSQRVEAGKVANAGDGGLDWIGFQKFKDRPWNIPVFFAQCACGQDYFDKQLEASRVQWNSLVDLRFPTFTFIFTPQCHRGNDNELTRPEKIIDELVFVDRFRLIEMLKWDETMAQKSVALYQNVLNEFLEKVDAF